MPCRAAATRGRAVGANGRIMDIEPKDIHERTPLVVGSLAEVDEFDTVASGS